MTPTHHNVQQGTQEETEAAYVRGQNAGLRTVLATVLRELNGNGEETERAPLVLSETRAALIKLAGELGIDVHPELHPADIVRAIGKEVL